MHTIEPFFNWRHLYQASEDSRSPFYGYFNSEVYFTDAIFDHVIHPQWDSIGCETLYIKVLYADYSEGYAIIELFGEWNDVLYNDVMRFKRDFIDPMIEEGLDKFILIGDNLLNFHADITDYYDEWLEDVQDGWMALLNIRPHVLREMSDYGIDAYFLMGGTLDDFSWRTKSPKQVYEAITKVANRRLY
ncbi:MAG: hypothetical protein RL754_238 [Bacteroidota bacterium]|jgi:hypothetical protein